MQNLLWAPVHFLFESTAIDEGRLDYFGPVHGASSVSPDVRSFVARLIYFEIRKGFSPSFVGFPENGEKCTNTIFCVFRQNSHHSKKSAFCIFRFTCILCACRKQKQWHLHFCILIYCAHVGRESLKQSSSQKNKTSQ